MPSASYTCACQPSALPRRLMTCATHLFLHGTGCAQPVCQRNLRIVCIVPGLRDNVRNAHGGVDGGHSRSSRGCSGVADRGSDVCGFATSRARSDRLSVGEEMTRLHLDIASLFRGCLAAVSRSGHCDGCPGCFGSGANSKVEPRNLRAAIFQKQSH